MIREHRAAIAVASAFAAIRLAVAPLFGLGVDEAHYVLYGLRPALSYVDHPPLTGWIHLLFNHLLGGGELVARLPAIVLSFVLSLLVYQFLLGISESKRTALLGSVAVNASFIPAALGIMLLPDSILMVLAFLFIAAVKKVESQARWRDFLLLGALLGMAGLTKYTAVLFLPPLIGYLLLKRRSDLLFSGKMVAAGCAGLILITPVVLWNYFNDFLSFSYQTGRVFPSGRPDAASFFTSLASQIVGYSPFLFAIACWGFIRSVKAKNDYLILSALLGASMMLFFTYSSFYEVALPHWYAVFYALFIPIGVFKLRESAGRKTRIFLNFSVYFTLCLTALLYLLLAGRAIPFPDYQSPFRDIYGYDLIARQADRHLQEIPGEKKALALTEWTMASRVIYYSLKYDNRVFLIDRRRDQFDLWEKTSPLGYDLVFINSHFSGPMGDPGCGRFEQVSELPLAIRGGLVDKIGFYRCYNYRGKN